MLIFVAISVVWMELSHHLHCRLTQTKMKMFLVNMNWVLRFRLYAKQGAINSEIMVTISRTSILGVYIEGRKYNSVGCIDAHKIISVHWEVLRNSKYILAQTTHN